MKKLVLIFSLLCGVLTVAAPAQQSGDLIPAEEFYKLPEFVMVGLNDAGDTMAVLAPLNDRMGLFAIDLATREIKALAADKNRDVDDAYWVNNERLFFSWDDEGFASGGVWAINKDGSRYREIAAPARNTRGVFRYTAPLDLLDDRDDYILVVNNERRMDYPDVYLMEVNNGNKRRVVMNPGKATGYVTDHNGVVRIAVVVEDDGSSQILYRETDDDDWEELRSFEEESVNFSPLAFTPDNKNLYVSSNLDRDTRAVFYYDLEKREIGEQIIADDTYDIGGGLVLGPEDNRLIAIQYQQEKPAIAYFDDKWSELQQMIDQVLPDTVNRFTSWDDDERLVIVSAFTDRKPVEYYLLDTEELAIERLFGTREWIEPEMMAEQKPIRFPARDGEMIPGYVSMPPDWDGEPIPFIMYPHGGPWARDQWGFDWWRQFMVSRGYGVMQVDFRGSTGYGKEHLKVSFKNGQVMMDDVYDGLQWAIAEGYADPKRIGIAGASGGGWKTMYMLGRYPETFDFGINIFGVVDVALQIKDYIDEWDREPAYKTWVRRMGDPEIPEEMEELKALSPMTYIDNITQPVLIYHGERDINVDIKQSRILREALEDRGNEPVWVYAQDEAHSFSQLETRKRLFTAMDEFLQNMQARWEKGEAL